MSENNSWKVERAEKIAGLIQTGIENENGEVRQFDILDYYQLVHISPKSLYDATVELLVERCSAEELNGFYSFAIRNNDDKRITSETIMSINHMFLINGKVKVVTNEEKMDVIHFLADNKIRLTNNVYSVALKRYIEGELGLVFDNKKEKSKTRVR